MTKKALVLILIFLVAVLSAGGWAYYYFYIEKSLKLIYPNGQEVFETNKTYQIFWKAKKIGTVGIMLVKESSKETKWIAKELSALDGRYDWNVFVWEEPRDDYRIAIFEYPWAEGKMIDYSDQNFTIVGPQFASCDALSIEKEWPFLPSDYPDLRRVFITKKSWNGNLEGLEGADKKCQEQAEAEGFEGTWKAFLGDDQTLAIDRLTLEGFFVNARPAGTLTEGKTCHQLWGKNFEEFFQKFSDTLAINQEKFENDFLQKELSSVWLGRITKESKRDCVTVFSRFPSSDQSRNYSFTATCQNWTSGDEMVLGYPSEIGTMEDFPKCYTPAGDRINAAAVTGLSAGLVGIEGQNQYFSPYLGKYCNTTQKLICIQQ